MWLERLSTTTAHRVTGMAVMVSRRTTRDSNVPRFQLSPFDATGIRIAVRERCSSLRLLRKWRDRIAIDLPIANARRRALMQTLRRADSTVQSLTDQDCRSVNERIEMLDAESIRIDQKFY
ncbi:MAG: hypothetical protein RO009_07100 [Pseudorhodoplanes sp.]|jgi:hypothetical protein|nr:hypothetical protein [Pseudorhodoplanes sp.]